MVFRKILHMKVENLTLIFKYQKIIHRNHLKFYLKLKYFIRALFFIVIVIQDVFSLIC